MTSRIQLTPALLIEQVKDYEFPVISLMNGNKLVRTVYVT